MVPEESAPLSLEDRLASPMDRFAAVVADFVLLSPIAALVTAPFHRFAEEAQLQNQDDKWLLATASAFGAVLLLAIAYQTVFLMKWRATPGKRLLGLTVESLWQEDGEPMRAQAAFVRAVAWCLEIALLGLPWISVIGNERRRPFHDRLADTIVLSKRKSRVGPPGLHEMSLASGLIAAFFTSILIVAVAKIGAPHFGSQKNVAPDADELSASNGACEQVDHAVKSWVEGLGEEKPSRMSLALALYEADSIDEECLKAEADSTLWTSDQKDLSYLARGLAEKNDEELSQTYLGKACDGTKETDACKALALLNNIELPSDPVEAKAARVERDSEILSLISTVTAQSEPFLKVLAIRELTQAGQPTRALAMLDTFSPQKDLSFFIGSERMKTLWSLGRKPEARLSLNASVAGFESDQRAAIARWFCQAETATQGCSKAAKNSCDLLAASVEHDSVLLGDPEVTVAYLRGEACSQRLDEEKLKSLAQEMPDQNSQSYVDALIQLKKDPSVGRAKLQSIADKGDAAGAFFTEAQAQLIDLAQAEKDLTPIREAWLDSDSLSDDGWVFVGRRLMKRYNDFKAWDQTVETGFKIGEGGTLDADTARYFIVAAYKSGQTKMAMAYLQTYFGSTAPDGTSNEKTPAGGSDLRQPASLRSDDEDFEQISREIRADFDSEIHGSKSSTRKTNGDRLAIPTRLPPKARRGTAQ